MQQHRRLAVSVFVDIRKRLYACKKFGNILCVFADLCFKGSEFGVDSCQLLVKAFIYLFQLLVQSGCDNAIMLVDCLLDSLLICLGKVGGGLRYFCLQVVYFAL